MKFVLMLVFEKSYLHARKTLRWLKFSHLWPIFDQLAIWEILAYIFQTPKQIFVTFGMEAVLLVFLNQFVKNLDVFLPRLKILRVFGIYAPKIAINLSSFPQLLSILTISNLSGNQSYIFLRNVFHSKKQILQKSWCKIKSCTCWDGQNKLENSRQKMKNSSEINISL